jgi:hypothetical protein
VTTRPLPRPLSPRTQAIISQKQDTIRWSFNYGGINTFTRDDDGNLFMLEQRKRMQVVKLSYGIIACVLFFSCSTPHKN